MEETAAVTSASLRDEYDILLTYGDVHIPNQHAQLMTLLLEIIKDVEPDILVDGGDIICADCLSTYPKVHDDLVGLQEELNAAIKWLEAVQSVTPRTRRIILRDNHFWGRLEKKKKGEYWLEGLEAVNADALLKLKDFGFESIDCYNWKDRILFVHGDDKSGSSECPVNRSRKMSQMAGKTIVRFHSHVTGIEMNRKAGVDHMAIQMGTFQDPNNASYLRYPNMTNWTHSAGVFYLSKTTDHFMFVPILFVDGRAIFNGKIYG